MADLLGIDRRVDKQNPSYQAIKTGDIPKEPARLKKLLGILEHKEKGVLTGESSRMYDRSRYKFFLDAPFNISSMCCNVMKKQPMHTYSRQTGRKPMTAQMASESKMRTQKWLQNGCNRFDMKSPISNPMAFWTEQDVLLYIKENNLPIASVYGEVVIDYEAEGQLEGQMDLSDLGSEFGIFDIGRKLLKTTGCDRTGCMFCGYGCHLEKSPNRFERMKETHPKVYDYIMRGGHWKYRIFNFKGEEISLKHCSQEQIESWVVQNKDNIRFKIENHSFYLEGTGLVFKEIIDWINKKGNMNIKY